MKSGGSQGIPTAVIALALFAAFVVLLYLLA
jgi:hypothetical protein